MLAVSGRILSYKKGLLLRTTKIVTWLRPSSDDDLHNALKTHGTWRISLRPENASRLLLHRTSSLHVDVHFVIVESLICVE